MKSLVYYRLSILIKYYLIKKNSWYLIRVRTRARKYVWTIHTRNFRIYSFQTHFQKSISFVTAFPFCFSITFLLLFLCVQVDFQFYAYNYIFFYIIVIFILIFLSYKTIQLRATLIIKNIFHRTANKLFWYLRNRYIAFDPKILLICITFFLIISLNVFMGILMCTLFYKPA